MKRTSTYLLALSLLGGYSSITPLHAQDSTSAGACIDGICSDDGLILALDDQSDAAVAANVGEPAGDVRAVTSLYTSQEPVNYSRRLRIQGPQVATLRSPNSNQLSPVAFYLDANYMDFIAQWEIEIGIQGESGETQNTVVKRYASNQVTIGEPIIWDGSIDTSSVRFDGLDAGDKITYRLKAYDANGNVDVTTARTIDIIDSVQDNPNNAPGNTISSPDDQNWYALMGDRNDLEQEGIRLPSATLVRYHLEDLNRGDAVTIDQGNVNARYPVGDKNDLVIERLYAAGDYQSQIGIQNARGQTDTATIPVQVDGDYFFMVGLADLTIGENEIDATSTVQDGLSIDRHYQGDVYTDGRIAFYLKGKIKGSTLITAQMDTGTEDLGDLFSGIHRKDREALFRRIDPDRFYPVYGDDSTITRDVDTAGKFYVRLERDQSEFIWGNYNTGISGNSLASYNRSLYGAKGVLATDQSVANGEARASITAFASEADTKAAQDRFLATGGSLYYLRHQDLALGSAKVQKVFVDSTGFERKRVELEEGRDYQINEFQGRIILNRAFQDISGDAGDFDLNSANAERAILVVDYEYIPDSFEDSDELNAGARVKGWVNDNIGIGATYIEEETPDGDYKLQGVDLTLRQSENTYVKLEFADSEGNTDKQINSSGIVSSTLVLDANNNLVDPTAEDIAGGLRFTNLNDEETTRGGGQAFRAEARVGLADYTNTNGYVEGWYQTRDAGFASTDGRNLSLRDGKISDYGIALSAQALDNLLIKARAERSTDDDRERTQIGVQADYQLDDLTLSAQVLNDDEQNNLNPAEDRDRTQLGIQARYRFSDSLNAYINAKGVIDETNWGERDGSVGVGVEGRLTDKITYNADYVHAIGSDAADNIQVGLGYALNDNLDIYANLNANIEDGGLDDGGLTVGQRATISDKLALYSEHQFRRDNDDRSQTINTFGGDYALTDTYSIGASYGSNDSDTSDLQAVSVYGSYNNNDDLSFSNKIEWRQEDRLSGAEETQILLTNTLRKKVNEDLRLLADADYSRTERSNENVDTAHFAEVDLGLSYRPVANNKLNVLGMYSFLYELDPLGQVNADAFDERAHILSIEGIYELSSKWEIGAKLAHKESEFRPRNKDGDWEGTSVSLGVARLRYHLLNKWDALGEYRYLTTSDAGDESGGLLAIERQIGKNLKVGVGYNFASFDDDLKNQGPNNADYDASGWFLNVVGKY